MLREDEDGVVHEAAYFSMASTSWHELACVWAIETGATVAAWPGAPITCFWCLAYELIRAAQKESSQATGVHHP